MSADDYIRLSAVSDPVSVVAIQRLVCIRCDATLREAQHALTTGDMFRWQVTGMDHVDACPKATR